MKAAVYHGPRDVRIEERTKTTYKGIDVYKLQFWHQGPAMLQALNILDQLDHHDAGKVRAKLGL